MFNIVDDNFLSVGEKNIIAGIAFNSYFPLYFSIATSEKFPYLSHQILLRDDEKINSKELYDIFSNIIKGFCKKHSIEFNKISRMSINVTFENSKYELSEPHIDDVRKHKVLILYLNDLPFNEKFNSTILFDEKINPNSENELFKNTHISMEENEDFIKEMKIFKEVHPKFGRIFCFDGEHYHAIRFPEYGTFRYIFVANFS